MKTKSFEISFFSFSFLVMVLKHDFKTLLQFYYYTVQEAKVGSVVLRCYLPMLCFFLHGRAVRGGLIGI